MIISNSELFSIGLKKSLEMETDFTVQSFKTMITEDVVRHLYDIYCVDIDLTSNSIKPLIKTILQYNPEAKIILFYEKYTSQLKQYMNTGIVAFLKKSITVNELVLSIRAVLNNQALFPFSLIKQLSCYSSHNHSEEGLSNIILSKKEIEILHCVAEGNSNKQISEKLFMSVRSVEYHLSKIFKILRVSSRSEALSQAIRIGLITILDNEVL